MGTAAGGANACDQESVAGGAEPVREAHRVAQLEDLVVAELNDPVARRAMQMIMGRIAIVVLECAAIRQPQLAQKARVNQQAQRSIDRRPADLVAGIVQITEQFVGIKVLVGIEDMANEHPTRLGQLLAADLEKFTEFLHRRIQAGQRGQKVSISFPDNSGS
jgi:hypothetical protein